MEKYVLHKYLLDSGFFSIDESEHKTIFTDMITKQEEKLKAILDETQMKEVNHYRYNLIGHMFNIREIECFKMLYLGIKLGMEVADFIAEEYKEI